MIPFRKGVIRRERREGPLESEGTFTPSSSSFDEMKINASDTVWDQIGKEAFQKRAERPSFRKVYQQSTNLFGYALINFLFVCIFRTLLAFSSGIFSNLIKLMHLSEGKLYECCQRWFWVCSAEEPSLCTERSTLTLMHFWQSFVPTIKFSLIWFW